MIEVLVVLVILGVIATMAISSQMKPHDEAVSAGGRLTLAAAVVDVNKDAYNNYGHFPEELNPNTPSLTYTQQAATEQKQISYKRVDALTVVLATLDPAGKCTWVYDTLETQARWGTTEEKMTSCDADQISGQDVNDKTTSTDAQYPSKVSLG